MPESFLKTILLFKAKFFKMNLYVSNLNLTTKEEELRIFFQKAGEVASIKIISYQNGSKGFGFVELPDNGQALEAIHQLAGRKPVISKALEKSNRY